MKSIVIVFGLLLLAAGLLITPVLADEEDAPVLPLSTYGTVVYSDGETVASGTVITATIGDIISEYTVTEDGKIGEIGSFGEKFIVNGDSEGETVIFKIGDNVATQTLTFEPGSAKEINLVFSADQKSSDTSSEPEQTSDSSEQQTSTATSGSNTQSSGKTEDATPVPTSVVLPSSTTSASPTVTATTAQSANPSDLTTAATSQATETQKSPAPIGGILIGILGAGFFVSALKRR